MSVSDDSRLGRKTVAKCLSYFKSKFVRNLCLFPYKLTCGLCYEI